MCLGQLKGSNLQTGPFFSATLAFPTKEKFSIPCPILTEFVRSRRFFKIEDEASRSPAWLSVPTLFHCEWSDDKGDSIAKIVFNAIVKRFLAD